MRKWAQRSLDLCIVAVVRLFRIAMDVCLMSVFISHVQRSLAVRSHMPDGYASQFGSRIDQNLTQSAFQEAS